MKHFKRYLKKLAFFMCIPLTALAFVALEVALCNADHQVIAVVLPIMSMIAALAAIDTWIDRDT